jgi:hypothetical protein
MPQHRFKIGETVRSYTPGLPPGPYVIVRLLPLVGNEPQYRVRGIEGRPERALLEGQIRLVAIGEPSPVKPRR